MGFDPQSELLVDLSERFAKLQGWVLVEGRVLNSEQLSTPPVLVFETQDQVLLYHHLKPSLTGRVLEVVQLPANLSRVQLGAAQGKASAWSQDLDFKSISWIESYWRRWWRVLPAFKKMTPRRRKRLGFYWYTPLLDLAKAYQISGDLRGFAPPLPYPAWIEEFDTLSERDVKKIFRLGDRIAEQQPPLQVVILGAHFNELFLWQQTLDSLSKQYYKNFRLSVVAPQPEDLTALRPRLPASVRVISQAEQAKDLDAAWVVTLVPGAELVKQALFWFAYAAQKGKSRLVYSDHDRVEQNKRVEPQFKPDWSLELARASGYPGAVLALQGELFIDFLRRQAKDPKAWASPYALLMDAAAYLKSSQIEHVPAILWHEHQTPQRPALLLSALEKHLATLGIKAGVNVTEAGYLRVHYPLPANLPLVSILVPTRDLLSHLQPCVESLLSKTTYPNFELLVIDNQSEQPETLAFFDEISRDDRVRVVHYDKPFNFSAINNFAAEQACGDYLCLLNNDTEVITPAWLEEMVAQALQPGVGVVGARLYFSDGSLQHAGDTVGPGGCASHLHGALPLGSTGYMDRVILPQDLSAVTAACLLTPANLYKTLGGLDEVNLTVAFNDVDYCLRVREAGYRVVYTPYAELYHHESVSRGKDEDPVKMRRAKAEANYMRRRWADVMLHDPFYNPNLSYVRADFSLSHAPLVEYPWK